MSKSYFPYLLIGVIAIVLQLHARAYPDDTGGWKRYPGNPVFVPGGPGSWDQHFIDASIIRDDTIYHMWYTAHSKDVLGYSNIGYAWSKDGLAWTRYENNPLIMSQGDSSWYVFFWTFDVIRDKDGFFMIFTAEHSDPETMVALGAARSGDGIHWTVYPDPVLYPGGQGSWEELGIGGPSLYYDGTKYHLWYNAIPNEMPKIVEVGYATSEDGINWKKSGSNPVLRKGNPGEFDDRWATATDVNYVNGRFEMWYFGYNYLQYNIGFATSLDGINWERSPENPVMHAGKLGFWDASFIAALDVIHTDTACVMWYYGKDNIREGIGYASNVESEAISWEDLSVSGARRQVRVQIFNETKLIRIDSLLNILPQVGGFEKVDALNGLALAYSLNDEKASHEFATRALALADSLDYPVGKAYALYSLGTTEYVRGQYENAVSDQLKALWLFDSLGMGREAGNLCLQIAGIHTYAGLNNLAERYLKRALDLFRRTDDTASALVALKYLGMEYLVAGDTIRARKIFRERLDLAWEYSAPNQLAQSMEDVGITYGKNNIDSAKYFFMQAINIWDTVDKTCLGIAYLKMGRSYLRSGKQYYSEAEKCLNTSYIHLLGLLGGSLEQLDLIFTLSEYYLSEGNKEKAREYLDKTLDVASLFLSKQELQPFTSLNEKLEHDMLLRSYLEQVHRLYFDYYMEEGNEGAALVHFMHATAWKDSIYNDRNFKKLAMIQAEHESETSRNSISLLERENEVKTLTLHRTRIFLFSTVGLILVVGLLAVSLIRQNRIRAEQRSIELEQKLFRIQMNPHFIFNSLAGIMNFIHRNDLDKAMAFLGSFSHLLRSTLQGSREDYIPLEDEIKNLKNYLDLQSIRYQNKFLYRINVQDRIQTSQVLLPPMLIQPFVENAIEHGINNKEGMGLVSLGFELVNSSLRCTVEDDGIGRVAAGKINYSVRNMHKSLATDIIQDRIRSLNRKWKHSISLKVIDLDKADGSPAGTRVELVLPLLRES